MIQQRMYGSYVVYSDGRVYSTFKNKFLKPYVSSNGYERLRLYSENGWESHTMHRLVATLFLGKPEGKNQVNHKNGIKTDNRVENLEWCTGSENQKHSWAMGLIKSAYAKVVLDTQTGIFYESASELARFLGINKVYFIQKLNGYRKNNTQYIYA